MSSTDSAGVSRIAKTEAGGTGLSRFIVAIWILSRNAESTSILYLKVHPKGPNSVSSQAANSSFPPVQLENPLSCAVKGIEGLSQQANGSHGVYAEELGFCLSWV